MKRILSFWAVAVLCLTSISIAFAEGEGSLTQSNGSGGGASSGGIYTLSDAIGQVGAGEASGGIYQVNSGSARVLAADAVVAPADGMDANQVFTSDEPTEAVQEEQPESAEGETVEQQLYLPLITNQAATASPVVAEMGTPVELNRQTEQGDAANLATPPVAAQDVPPTTTPEMTRAGQAIYLPLVAKQ